MTPNQSAAANRRPAGQSDGSGNLSAIVAADRAFPAAVAELGRSVSGRTRGLTEVYMSYFASGLVYSVTTITLVAVQV